MKAEFIRWYEAVALPLDPDVADARRVAVKAVAESVSREELEALIRAAFRSKQQTIPMTGGIRTKLAGRSGVLEDEEFRLLAAAALTYVLRANNDSAALAAAMVSNASLCGLRTLKQPMDILGLANTTRAGLARSTRRRPVLQMPAMPSLTVDPQKAVETEDSNEALELLAAACSESLNALAERQFEYEQQTARYISIQDEELNMLWWLQGGRSQTLDLPFVDIPRAQRPIVLACELAEATFTIPGTASILSLMARAGLDELESLTMVEVVQSLPTETLREVFPVELEAKISPVTTPLHEAFKRRLEVDGNSWVEGWASVCDLDTETKFSPLQLAERCYCEQVVLRK
jgi:hypothetical protein